MQAQQSTSFNLLDARIQYFLWADGWESLRDAQEEAIPLILPANRDVIIAAATAAGKTEAAFLPALTHLQQTANDALIVYISPLKALINDQFGRLSRLCEQLEIPVWPWHGDISATRKAQFIKRPGGVLLITPESLEAFLCNRGSAISAVFASTAYFVIDELHAFIGTERGKQLQSILHRIDNLLAREAPRIGLSATLGDMNLAAEFLRPGNNAGVALVVSKSDRSELRILVKGYEEPTAIGVVGANDESEATTPAHLARHLFKTLRGSNNLVFPNCRREVERYTHLLSDLCANANVPNEFWPHNGSLSKEIRQETEAALKQRERPATAICTNTLELGIDIGAVKSVAQIGPPPSVASLRQRLGRSGRRKGEPAILRGYCIENALNGAQSIATRLRLETVQMIAMISLLLDGWFEPPMAAGLHLSTLVQQILSVVAQQSGSSIGHLYTLLCSANAPFPGLSKLEFAQLIRHLGAAKLLMQDDSGVLLHGEVGEKFVNHFSFYAAFAAEEEFRIVSSGEVLGSLPVSQMLTEGQRILFGGRTWRVEEINAAERTIFVSRAKSGAPPLFAGGCGRIHTSVRQRMRSLLEATEPAAYLDDVAARFLTEARDYYHALKLNKVTVLTTGGETLLFTWMGDNGNEALACLLKSQGLTATFCGPCIEVHHGEGNAAQFTDILLRLANAPLPSLQSLLPDVDGLRREKWDWSLPDDLLRRAYASLYLNLDEALRWLKTLRREPGQGHQLHQFCCHIFNHHMNNRA